MTPFDRGLLTLLGTKGSESSNRLTGAADWLWRPPPNTISCFWISHSRASQAWEILKEVRELMPVKPVIILTAKGSEHERVEGLKLGADDYVVKPFSILELLARIEAVLRRSPSRQSNFESINMDGCVVDFSRREIRFGEEQIELSEKETELLYYLARHSNRAISRDELLANVWRLTPKGLSTRTIDMHIARLREKLKDNDGAPKWLLTVRGKGYKFQLPYHDRVGDAP